MNSLTIQVVHSKDPERTRPSFMSSPKQMASGYAACRDSLQTSLWWIEQLRRNQRRQ